jgi:hypothetical protein
MNGKSEEKGGGNAPLRIDSGVVGGSTGGASEADLSRGYTKPGEANDTPSEGGLLGSFFPEENNTGFLNRPTGWER